MNFGGGFGWTEGGSGSGSGGAGNQCITQLVEQGSVESKRYYLSRKTVLEMLRDRGYNVSDSEITRSLSEFRANFPDNSDLNLLRICVNHRSNPNQKILVVFLGTEDVKIATIRGVFAQIMNKESLHGLILILQSKMNHFARKELAKFPCKVEVFQITELLVNITKHITVPNHEILTAQQKQKLLNEYEVEGKQLPTMLKTDAVARYYGLEKGQVVKITYSGGFADSLVTYRCVT